MSLRGGSTSGSRLLKVRVSLLMVDYPAMLYCKIRSLEMQLKPLMVAVIALKDKTIIILEALIAYEGER